MKTNIKIVIGVIIGIILSGITASAVADFKIDSRNVFYKDNSGLGFNNVQDAIDGTCTKFEEKVDAFLDKVYPVGSVYISTTLDTPAKVKTAIGGTWETYGKGQTLVGVDTSQNEFKTVNTTGGAKSVSYTPKGTIGSTGLTIDQIPSHSHNIEHTHTTAASSITNGVAANTTSTWIDAAPPADNYGSGTNTTGSLLQHYSTLYGAGSYSYAKILYTNIHSHTVTGTIPSLSTNSISTTSSGAAGKGTTSDGHTHSFTGTAANISTLQPYITVYMYKRVN